jgi:hypothetical protein
VEASVKPGIQFGVVGVHAVERRPALGILDPDVHQGLGEQFLHGRHGLDEPLALLVAQRLEHGPGQFVAAPVELGPFAAPQFGQFHEAHPVVVGGGTDADEVFALELAQQAAQVPSVQIELLADRAHVDAGIDLPEHPRRAERAITREVLVVERANALGDGPVETADGLD